MASTMSDLVLTDAFWNDWHDSLVDVHRILEEEHVNSCPAEELPLLVNNLVHKENEKHLNKRLKDGPAKESGK